MKNNKLSLSFAYILFTISVTIALVAAPFTLIAGLGLILAVPFGFFAKQELKIINNIKTKSKITKQAWNYRYRLLIACGAGVNAILLLIWLTNNGNFELTFRERITPVILCNAFMVVFSVLTHLTKSNYIKNK